MQSESEMGGSRVKEWMGCVPDVVAEVIEEIGNVEWVRRIWQVDKIVGIVHSS